MSASSDTATHSRGVERFFLLGSWPWLCLLTFITGAQVILTEFAPGETLSISITNFPLAGSLFVGLSMLIGPAVSWWGLLANRNLRSRDWEVESAGWFLSAAGWASHAMIVLWAFPQSSITYVAFFFIGLICVSRIGQLRMKRHRIVQGRGGLSE